VDGLTPDPAICFCFPLDPFGRVKGGTFCVTGCWLLSAHIATPSRLQRLSTLEVMAVLDIPTGISFSWAISGIGNGDMDAKASVSAGAVE
jgi:hypothetical protein